MQGKKSEILDADVPSDVKSWIGSDVKARKTPDGYRINKTFTW